MKLSLQLSLCLILLMCTWGQTAFTQGGGKQMRDAQRAVKAQNYPGACLYAMEALKLNQKKKSAQEIVSKFYPLAVEDLRDNIEKLSEKSAEFEDESTVHMRMEVVRNFKTLHELDKELGRVQILIPKPKYPMDHERMDVENELAEAESNLESGKDQLAETLMVKAMKLMESDAKKDNKQAALHLKKIQTYRPGYQNSLELFGEAKEKGTTVLGIIPMNFNPQNNELGDLGIIFAHSLTEKLSLSFQSDEFIRVLGPGEFEAIQLTEDMGSGPEPSEISGSGPLVDILISGTITEANVRASRVTRGSYETSTASVITGYTTYVNEKGKKRKKPVMGEVSATHRTAERSVIAHIGGNIQVTQVSNRFSLFSDNFQTNHPWSHCWKEFQGDPRAVTLGGCSIKDKAAPPHATLMREAIQSCIKQASPHIVQAVD